MRVGNNANPLTWDVTMQTVIFDIDKTLVDSSHRQLTLPDGTLDLAHWIENNTPEKIMQDKLLPCVTTLRRDFKAGCKIVLCTARVIGDADVLFFFENDIPYHHLLARPEGCTMPDADLKELHLRLYADQLGISWARFCQTSIFYDDAASVLERMAKIGIETIDAVWWNKHLKLAQVI